MRAFQQPAFIFGVALRLHDLVVAELPLAAGPAVHQVDGQQGGLAGERLVGFGGCVGLIQHGFVERELPRVQAVDDQHVGIFEFVDQPGCFR